MSLSAPTVPDACERELSEFGIQFGRHRIHQGQGTVNACAFFDNAYLEIVRRNDDEELQTEAVRPVSLWERVRWHETGASPFGVGFRPDDASQLTTWPYDAPFLPDGATIPIVTPQFKYQEPLLFLSLVSQAPATLPLKDRPPLEHRGRNRRVTGVTLYGPDPSNVSSGLKQVCQGGVLTLKPAPDPHMELIWDGETSHEFCDFRPTLPLVLRW